MMKRIALALATLSLVATAAVAQPAPGQDRAGMRLEQVPPNGQVQAPVVQRDPAAEADRKIAEWKQGRVNCLVAAGLKRPTQGFGVPGDDFIITEDNRVRIADWVWRRTGVNAQAAYACTPEAMAAAAQQTPRR